MQELAANSVLVYQSLENQGKDVYQSRTYLIPIKSRSKYPNSIIEFTKFKDKFNNLHSDL